MDRGDYQTRPSKIEELGSLSRNEWSIVHAFEDLVESRSENTKTRTAIFSQSPTERTDVMRSRLEKRHVAEIPRNLKI